LGKWERRSGWIDFNSGLRVASILLQTHRGLDTRCSRLRCKYHDFILHHLANSLVQIFPTLAIISKFRNLREVTLRVPTRLLQKGENDNSIDIDYHSANQIAVYLLSRKQGMPMEKLSVEVGVYNSLSGSYTAEWSTQRAKGHNPERHFVFTWDDAGEICCEDVKGIPEGRQTIRTLGLAKWLRLHTFPPN
jgi:hypothetical protein